MTETLSIRIDSATKKRLSVLAKETNRTNSVLAEAAINAYLELEEWQLGEIRAGIADADAGRVISHEKMKKWLSSWGKPGELKPPR